jgi:hypothetical protein
MENIYTATGQKCGQIRTQVQVVSVSASENSRRHSPSSCSRGEVSITEHDQQRVRACFPVNKGTEIQDVPFNASKQFAGCTQSQ